MEDRLRQYQETHGETIRTSDAYIVALLDQDELNFNREDLEASIAERLSELEHSDRTEDVVGNKDSNTEYHEGFNAYKERLSRIDLKKINLILSTLSDQQRVDEIGSLIQKDLSNGMIRLEGIRKDGTLGDIDVDTSQTELGGLVVLDPDKKIKLVPYEPERIGNNGAYSFPKIESRNFPLSVSTFHFHAVGDHDSRYSGPSSGDMIDLSKREHVGIVMTPISEDTFNIDYYRADGTIIDLGIYKYNK